MEEHVNPIMEPAHVLIHSLAAIALTSTVFLIAVLKDHLDAIHFMEHVLAEQDTMVLNVNSRIVLLLARMEVLVKPTMEPALVHIHSLEAHVLRRIVILFA
jgi:hypothetical protein